MPKYRVNIEISVTNGTAIIEADSEAEAIAKVNDMTKGEIEGTFDIATDTTYEVIDAWEED